jgi:glycosyltransferase involved in cell wall biosynthesis
MAYNHEPFIRQCLDGIVMQKTNFPVELLIHDDASTDRTAEIIREYEVKYPGLVKPIYEVENQYSKGIKMSLTYSFQRAKGKYIAHCDGDDYWLDPYKLQKQVDFLENHDEYSVCTSGYMINKDGVMTESVIRHGTESGFAYSGYDGWYWKTLVAVYRYSDLVDSRYFKDCKKYKSLRDTHLFHYLLSIKKGWYMSECFAVYNIHSGGIWSSLTDEQRIIKNYIIFKELYKVTRDVGPYNLYYSYLEHIITHRLYEGKGDRLRFLFEYYNKDMGTRKTAIRKVVKKLLNSSLKKNGRRQEHAMKIRPFLGKARRKFWHALIGDHTFASVEKVIALENRFNEQRGLIDKLNSLKEPDTICTQENSVQPVQPDIDFTVIGDMVWQGRIIKVLGNNEFILNKVREGKKIIIYGDNDLVEIFISQLNINIAYCINDKTGSICCCKQVMNVYELSYEEPGHFFVVVIQPNYYLSRIHKTLTEVGLIDIKDYKVLVHLNAYTDGAFLRDPYLGWSRLYNEHDNKFPGFKVYGEVGTRSLCIVTLGGSTTDPTHEGVASWTECLYYMLKEYGIDVTIFNGGYASYTSTEELIKLIRDVIPLHPDIVISYSGVNDFGQVRQQKNMENSHPRYKRLFISAAQEKIFSWISQQEDGATVLYGIQTDKSPAMFWSDNQRMMHSISEEFGIKFIGILQAHPKSEGMASSVIEGYITALRGQMEDNKNAFLNPLSTKIMYDEAEKEISDIPYILNFRHIFDEIADFDIYFDPAHKFERGNQIIAANVFENLVKMGYLDAK